MKVSNINRTDSGPPAVKNSGRGDAGVKSLEFRRTLDNLSQQEQESRLRDMASEINTQGEKLGKRADIKEFEKYRELIRNFLDEIVSSGYTFTKEDTYASRGRHRLIATVKTVNTKLDELGKEVISAQSENISLLGKIDEIRGLLVDMMQ
jgi:uncharacterized protein YaaR (DUF327 family)